MFVALRDGRVLDLVSTVADKVPADGVEGASGRYGDVTLVVSSLDRKSNNRYF